MTLIFRCGCSELKHGPPWSLDYRNPDKGVHPDSGLNYSLFLHLAVFDHFDPFCKPGQAGSGSGLPWAWQLRDENPLKVYFFLEKIRVFSQDICFSGFLCKDFQNFPESAIGSATFLGRRCARVRMSSAISSEFSFSVLVYGSFELSKILHIDLELWQQGWCFGFGKWYLNRWY